MGDALQRRTQQRAEGAVVAVRPVQLTPQPLPVPADLRGQAPAGSVRRRLRPAAARGSRGHRAEQCRRRDLLGEAQEDRVTPVLAVVPRAVAARRRRPYDHRPEVGAVHAAVGGRVPAHRQLPGDRRGDGLGTQRALGAGLGVRQAPLQLVDPGQGLALGVVAFA